MQIFISEYIYIIIIRYVAQNLSVAKNYIPLVYYLSQIYGRLLGLLNTCSQKCPEPTILVKIQT